MIMTEKPSFSEVKAYAPELFHLADRYELETVAGTIDFDLEIIDALDAALRGADDDVVLAHISPEHPGAAEATAILKAKLRQRFIA